MCRMIGIVGSPATNTAQTLQAFHGLCLTGRSSCGDSPGHEDGWGLSGYNGQRAVFFGKSPKSAQLEKLQYDLAVGGAAKSKSPVVIGHFRKASVGEKNIGNTHPFHYRDWVFAHNGTIYNAGSKLSLSEAQPQGSTDSERLGLWLLERMVPSMDPTAELEESIRQLRDLVEYSSLTFLLTNGKILWAYRESGSDRLEKEEVQADRDAYFTLAWTAMDRQWVICSEPLSAIGSRWNDLPNGTLAVFDPTRDTPIIKAL